MAAIASELIPSELIPSEEAVPCSLNSLTCLPFITISVVADCKRVLASSAWSFRLAGTVSLMAILLASKNLDARVQEVHPLRK